MSNAPQGLSPDAFNDIFTHVGAQLAQNFQDDTPFSTMTECIYQVKISEVQSEFVRKLLLSNLPLKINLDVISMHMNAN